MGVLSSTGGCALLKAMGMRYVGRAMYGAVDEGEKGFLGLDRMISKQLTHTFSTQFINDAHDVDVVK